MSENPIVEWQGKDGQKYRAIILRSFQFTGAHYIMGRMLDTTEELFLFATKDDRSETFLTITMNPIVLSCVISGLADMMAIVAVEKTELESKPRGLPA